MGLNLAVVLTDTALRCPDKPAVHVNGASVTFAQLDADSDKVAHSLSGLGIGPGHRVALILPNGLDFIATFFGVLKAGATAVPLNVVLRAGELRHCLSDCLPAAVITGSEQSATIASLTEDLDIQHVFVTGEGGGAACPWARSVGDGAGRAWVETDPGDTAVILYTSGTTGRPKGAQLTHSGMLWVAETIATRVLTMRPDDVVLQALPFSHIFALNAVMNVAFLSGASIVLEERFESDRALELMSAHGVSVFPGVPAMAMGLLSALERRNLPLPTLRVALLGGQAVPPPVKRRFADVFGCHTIESYGISEFCSAVAATSSEGSAKTASVGRPIWGAQVMIASLEDKPLRPGEVGEVCLRGTGLTTGYFGQPAASTEAFRGGWFHTGDLGVLDEDGDLFIVDRKKDMIIRGGYNVYPREVEDVLYTHPAVLEAAVVGVPDEQRGEEVAAAVRLRPGTTVDAEELRDFSRERLAPYKYPRVIAFVDALPTSSTGKLLKRSIDVEQLLSTAREQEARAGVPLSARQRGQMS